MLDEINKSSLVIALYSGVTNEWKSFGPSRPMTRMDVFNAELILTFLVDGTTKIVKNRWGNVS